MNRLLKWHSFDEQELNLQAFVTGKLFYWDDALELSTVLSRGC